MLGSGVETCTLAMTGRSTPMPDEFPCDVFLSHSAKDKAVVRPLAERLRADGVKVWFDEWVLKAEGKRMKDEG